MAGESRKLYSNSTPSQLAFAALRRSSDRIVLQDGSRSWTAAAALDCIATIQFHLEHKDCLPGGRVAVLSGNRPETWLIGVAVQGLGMCVSYLHPLGNLQSHIHQIDDFQPDVVIVDAARFPEIFADLSSRYTGQIAFLTLDGGTFGQSVLDRGLAGSQTVVDRSRPDDMAQINYTGGTTGRAKGAWRTNSSLAGSVVGALSDFELPRAPAYLAAGPISHVAGTKILPSLLRGGRVVMVDRFDPELLCETIARERISMTVLVPTMIYGLLDSSAIARHDLTSLELLLYGASPMSVPRLEQGLEHLGPVFSQLYGQTECYPIAVLPREDHDPQFPDRLTACGYPSHSCSIALLDPEGNRVTEGESGEICVRSPYIMGGYWRQPELTEATLAGGWLHTGDVGRFDEQGRLYIVDRIKDLIITGGFNVYPREVEDVIAAVPGVAISAVMGVPDSKWGEAVVAAVVAKPGARLDPLEIMSAVKAARGPVYAPKKVRIVDTLPLTAAGKVDKKVLKELHSDLWAEG